MTKLTIAAIVATIAGCASHPQTRSDQANLEQQANATLGEMRAKDPGIDNVLRTAYAYAVFPDVGKAGAIVGGAYGRGILFEQGRPVGSVKLEQASIGAQLGGQTFAELLVLRDPADADKLRAGHFDLGASASAVAIQAGAAKSAELNKGTVVFLMPRGGLMADLSVTGQRIDYQPFAG